MKLFAIKFCLEIFVSYLEYFNNIANNTRESKKKNYVKNVHRFMQYVAKEINTFHMQTK